MRPHVIKWLTAATSVGMFLVLIAGALVTKTESGRGCGDDWPLCEGKFIPAYTIESMIEYSHRAVTGIVGLLVLFAFIAVYKTYGKRSEAYRYAMGIVFFTVLQAILGAMAVKWEQSSAVMALHFGFSMLAFTFTLLLMLLVWRGSEDKPAAGIVGAGFRKLVWVITVYSYMVVYIGAFVRHTDSAGGCSGWPLCNNELVPELYGATGIAFAHRVAALLLFILIGWMMGWSWKAHDRRSEIYKLSLASFILVLLQVFSGALVAATIGHDNVYVFVSLLHTAIISGLFAVLGYLSIRVWQLRAA